MIYCEYWDELPASAPCYTTELRWMITLGMKGD